MSKYVQKVTTFGSSNEWTQKHNTFSSVIYAEQEQEITNRTYDDSNQ